jgi:hypothetical protein
MKRRQETVVERLYAPESAACEAALRFLLSSGKSAGVGTSARNDDVRGDMDANIARASLPKGPN